jgi:hypothetical protein
MLEEIGYFMEDNEMYEVIKSEGSHITIKALEMEDGVPWGFSLPNIMGDIIGMVMPYGKTKLETVYDYGDDPMDTRIIMHFDMRSVHKSGTILKYTGTVEVVR